MALEWEGGSTSAGEREKKRELLRSGCDAAAERRDEREGRGVCAVRGYANGLTPSFSMAWSTAMCAAFFLRSMTASGCFLPSAPTLPA